jgi:hypothetical protein
MILPRITEPYVTLTDYALALEGINSLVLLQRDRADPRGLRSWFSLFFASVIAASLCGGTVHGFFLDEQTQGHTILWPTTLFALGVTALSAWMIGAKLLFSSRVARYVLVLAILQFVFYSIAVLSRTEEFGVAIVNNLLAICFLIIAIGWAYLREKQRNLLLAAGGLILNLAAGLQQQIGIGIHPVYFNHNALYHVLQAIALYLFFLGSRRLICATTGRLGEENTGIKPSTFRTDELLETPSGEHHADPP